jgi:hypothetical protein
MKWPQTSATELDDLMHQVMEYSRLTKRELAKKSELAPETLSRITRRGTADFLTVAKLVRSAGMKISVQPPPGKQNQHRRLDARSLALHTLIAGKLAADPTAIERKVLPNIRRFKAIHAGTGTEALLEEWERACRKGMQAVMQLCIDPSERGQQLRQSSPMTGILSVEERKSIYDAYPA